MPKIYLIGQNRMIDAGDIFAEIDGAAGMVRFKDNPERYNTAELVHRVDAQIQKSIALAGRMQALNNAVRSLVLE